MDSWETLTNPPLYSMNARVFMTKLNFEDDIHYCKFLINKNNIILDENYA